MPTLTVKGHDVEVGDEFMALSPSDRQAWVNKLAATLPDEPSGLEKHARAFARPFTSYFPTQGQMAQEGLEQAGHGIGQLAGADSSLWERTKGAGNVALGTLGYVTSPINAGLRTFAGQPIQDLTGIPREWTEFGLGLALPIPRGARATTSVPTLPARPAGVTLSEGQLTRDLPTIQREQAALRGQSGPAAQRAAQAFHDQQQGELAAARANI